MYNNVVRNCVCIVQKCALNVIVRPVCYEIINSKVTSLSRPLNHAGYVVHQRNLCGDINKYRPELLSKNLDTRFLTEEESKEILAQLCKNPEVEKQIKLLEMEVELLRQDGDKAPSTLGPRDILQLLYYDTTSKRRKHLKFLWVNEKKNEAKILRKQVLMEEKYKQLQEQEEEEESDNHLKYGLGNNSMFLRIYQQTMNQYYNYRVLQCTLFEPNIVFDLGFSNNMSNHENANCAKQLVLAFASNRTHDEPMNIYFCNTDKSSLLMKYLHRAIPNVYDDDFPVQVTSKSYLDVFDKKKLIYLTPHCRKEMSEYDPNITYIIGGIVDTQNKLPLTLAKAKKEGIQMAKLPLEKYLKWGPGSGKNLTLNQVLNILLDIRHTGDWNTALKHIPMRKLFEANQNESFTSYFRQRKTNTYPQRKMNTYPERKMNTYPERKINPYFHRKNIIT